MSFDLNELRAQRERIREHLAWLDKQIADAAGEEGGAPPEATEVARAQSPVAPVASTVGMVTPGLTTPTGATAHPSPAVHEPMQYSPGEFGTSSKLGCVLMALLAVGAVIFLLFGLPYLMPESAFEKANSERVAKLEQRVVSVETVEQRSAVMDDIRSEIRRQKDIFSDYEAREQTLTKEAQNTKKTIRQLEELKDQAQMKAVTPAAKSAQ